SNETQAYDSGTSQQNMNNQVIMTGCIGRDATIRRTQNGNVVANFKIGVEGRHKDQRGQWRNKTSWHRVQVWNELAESLGPHLQEGMPVHVEGRLVNRVWIDQNDQKRFYTEIVAHDVRLLDTSGSGARNTRATDDGNGELQ